MLPTYRVTTYTPRSFQLDDWNKTRLPSWLSCCTYLTKRRDAGTNDALIKLILHHWNCTFFLAKPPIELAGSGYHRFVPQGCFPWCFWTKRVSVPRASWLTQDLGKKTDEQIGMLDYILFSPVLWRRATKSQPVLQNFLLSLCRNTPRGRICLKKSATTSISWKKTTLVWLYGTRRHPG